MISTQIGIISGYVNHQSSITNNHKKKKRTQVSPSPFILAPCESNTAPTDYESLLLHHYRNQCVIIQWVMFHHITINNRCATMPLNFCWA